MKNLTKKLFLSMLTVAFAVVALGTTTFAWFTLSKDAKVEAFEADVTGGSGFEIGVSAVDGTPKQYYTGSLPASAFRESGAEIIPTDFVFDALTIASNTPANDLTFNSLQVTGSTLNRPTDTTHFISFDIHFKLTNKANLNWNVFLTNYSFTGNGQAVQADAKYALTQEKTINLNEWVKYDVASAARLGIVHDGANLLYQAPQGGSAFTGSGTGKENPYVIGNTITESNQYGAYNYFSMKNNLSDSSNESLQTALADAYTNRNDDTVATEISGGEQQVATFQGGDGTAKITVFIWIEGWDSECMNPIFGQKLFTSLKFGIKEAAPRQ